MSNGKNNEQNTALVPEDYYFENGLMVFTATYHLKRGSCCGSGCRHCPYGGVAGSTEPILPANKSPRTNSAHTS